MSQAPCAGLNLGFTESDRRQRVEENHRRFFHELTGEGLAPASLRQVHSSHSFAVVRDGGSRLVYRLAGQEASFADPSNPPAGDALMTTSSGVLLTIRIADCLPLLLVDPSQRAVAAVHAGWRGALGQIIEKAVGDMQVAFGSKARDLIAAVGPCIRACCYDVGQEVVDAFHGRVADADDFFQPLPQHASAAGERFARSVYPPGHAPQHAPAARLDLTAVARTQLVHAGVEAANLHVADYCTACRTDLFFSHRREGPATGRQAAAIAIVDSEQ